MVSLRMLFGIASGIGSLGNIGNNGMPRKRFLQAALVLAAAGCTAKKTEVKAINTETWSTYGFIIQRVRIDPDNSNTQFEILMDASRLETVRLAEYGAEIMGQSVLFENTNRPVLSFTVPYDSGAIDHDMENKVASFKLLVYKKDGGSEIVYTDKQHMQRFTY